MKFTFPEIIFENKKRTPDEYSEIVKEIRRDILKSTALAKSGHPGGSLGIADIMSVIYFGGIMRYDAKNPNWSERDRFILSAGHLAPVLYSCLARAGFYQAEELASLRKLGSKLQGHPPTVGTPPGNETTSGSLGQGVSIALGMAISDKVIDNNNRKVFALTGDGELQEGSCWEAAMAAGMYKLDNFCWIVDSNDCQIDGRVKDVMSVYPLAEKFKAFNFNVIEIDGNNISQIIKAFDMFNDNHDKKIERPTCIIAKTFMGNGVSFMKDDYKWHGVPPTLEQAENALNELI